MLFKFPNFLITGHPEIATGPEDVVVNFGEDAMFTCAATGEPAPDVVWLRDSALLAVGKESHYEVMSNGTLMIHKADEKDIGIFECMAKNPAGNARSRPARMMLHAPATETGKIFCFKENMWDTQDIGY